MVDFPSIEAVTHLSVTAQEASWLELSPLILGVVEESQVDMTGIISKSYHQRSAPGWQGFRQLDPALD
jgi:hypothetical protein